MPILEVQGLVAGYGDVPILHGVDLTVNDGDVVTVVGPNGAGKSTLLKAIAGLVPVRAGTVHFQAHEITNTPPEAVVRLGIGYVPQVQNVFPSLTVSENLELIFPSGYPRDRRKAAMSRVVDMFPSLRAKWTRLARHLSGGERQVVAIARVMLMEPRLVILDEPSAALSPVVAQEIFRQVQRLHDDGVAILMVEQNARKALSISNRGYVLDGGRNALTASASELLSSPDVARLYLGQGGASDHRITQIRESAR